MGLSLGAEPQGGCGLQPRVAASATLGTSFRSPNRKAVAPVCFVEEMAQPRCG